MTRFRAIAAAVILGVLTPGIAAAQDAETLADIRRELRELSSQITGLRSELSTTGAAPGGFVSGSLLERVDVIEAELARLTSRTEELELRINRIVQDGTNRIGDLEFRLVELEGGDLGAIGETRPLGGETTGGAAPAPAPAAPPADQGAQLAVGEQADFDRAREVLDQGDFRSAANLFETFTETYTGGPLTGEAHYLRGEALLALGETSGAARAYLESFSGSPEGQRAPDALFKLGETLGALGQQNEACVTLAEVGARYPGHPARDQAVSAMNALRCN
ncbi:tol-pal system protein YbgF [Plastorhodobacter daqingensis]|uniref:Cell division coordinator CpoB n=1 Tax=Plastorhodobacter daqingensis TaxID=1387281 RepID=A0ABW2UQ90_9RHOB